MADDNGVFRWKPKSIKAVCLPADNCDIDQLLDELIENEQIARFEIDGKAYGAIHNFCKYQKPRKPVAVHPLTEAISAYVGKPRDNSSSQAPQEDEQVPQQRGTSSAKVRTSTEIPDQREEGGGNRNGNSTELPKRAGARKTYPDDFEVFWQAYPDRQGTSKAEAWTEWKKLDAEDRHLAADRLPQFKQWIAKQGKEYRTLHACRYLSKRRWEGFETAPPAAMSGYQIGLHHPARRDWIRHWEGREREGDGAASLKLSWYVADKTVREDTEYPPGTTPTTQPKEAAE